MSGQDVTPVVHHDGWVLLEVVPRVESEYDGGWGMAALCGARNQKAVIDMDNDPRLTTSIKQGVTLVVSAFIAKVTCEECLALHDEGTELGFVEVAANGFDRWKVHEPGALEALRGLLASRGVTAVALPTTPGAGAAKEFTRKFPLGGEEPSQKCTACGAQLEAHAGTACPTELPARINEIIADERFRCAAGAGCARPGTRHEAFECWRAPAASVSPPR